TKPLCNRRQFTGDADCVFCSSSIYCLLCYFL
ncbi:uncharacterized protein METZ01_LOCUS431056, partial [marine metagenome]